MATPQEHSHVRLLAGTKGSGDPVHEMVPSHQLDDGSFEVLGTPGLVNGCAAGDVIDVEPDGRFTVRRRGGNVAIHVYPDRPFDPDAIDDLDRRFRSVGGRAEGPQDGRFAVVTVPVTAGFPAIESEMARWVATAPAADWYFGNVYDDAGDPLGWWEPRQRAGGADPQASSP